MIQRLYEALREKFKTSRPCKRKECSAYNRMRRKNCNALIDVYSCYQNRKDRGEQ